MFRVTVSGTFDGLSEDGRVAVLAASRTAFTEAGTFTHDDALSAFTFRCQVPAGPDDGEAEATRGALAALDAHDLPYRLLRIAVTDMRTIKIRRRGRG